MPLDKSTLFNLLKNFDEEATKKIILVAVGGTAMTLLDLKTSTIDIDFTIPHDYKPEFDRLRTEIPHGFKIDVWPDGSIFCTTLPDDYLSRSSNIKNFEKITLRALHPLDIVVTKIGRLDKRDVQDIKACIEKCNIKKEEIQKRAESVIFVSKEDDYQYNLRWVIENLF